MGSGEPIVCRCLHTSPEAIISWLVNGSSLTSGLFPDIKTDSVVENGTIVYTLTIPARSEYNRAEVECVAFFLDGSPTETTLPAILTIDPGNYLTGTATFILLQFVILLLL